MRAFRFDSVTSFLNTIAVALSFCLFAGCSTTEHAERRRVSEVLEKAAPTWVGHHKSELIRTLGPPRFTFSDDKGGEVLSYLLTRLHTEKATAEHHTPPLGEYVLRKHKDYKLFYVKPEGYVYATKWGSDW